MDDDLTIAHGDPQSAPPDRNPAIHYLARLSPASRRTQRVALDRVAELVTRGAASGVEMPWHRLDTQHTQAIRRAIQARYAPPTINRMLAAIRGVLKEAWRLGLMDAERYHRAAALENVPWSTPPRGRTLVESEIHALFTACANDTTPSGVRDAALLTVLYAGGLRRSEVTALDLADYDVSSGALTIRSTAASRERVVYAEGSAAQALERWIVTRGNDPGPLFVPVNKGGTIRIPDGRMSDQSIRKVLAKRGQQAGVAAFSCQDLRRTFITQLLASGADIATVQRLAGHASPTTTQRYDQRSQVVQRELARMLAVPACAE